MKLNVFDRVTLLSILPPPEGDYLTFKIRANLRTELSFSEEELKECNITQATGKVQWDKSIDKEIEIGDKAKEIIQMTLKERLDAAGRINENNVSLYEKFII